LECLDTSFADCTNDSKSDCSREEQPDFSYDTHEYEIKDSDKRFDFDKLSERDYEIFNSKAPEYWEADGQNTSLRQVLMIHRHGDRTPINFAPNDPLSEDPFWKFHGPGQLTNRGKARLYMLGQIIRMRYNKFLEGSVNKNLRKSRASGALRCIDSAQVFLSSFLGLHNVPDSPDAGDIYWDRSENQLSRLWQPANVITLPAKIDGMLNEGSYCKALYSEYELIDNSEESKRINQEYQNEIKLFKEILDFDIDHYYKWFWGSSFLEVELSYMKDKVDPRLAEAYSRIEKAGNRALVLYQSTLKAKKLRAGLLIDDMIKNMINMRKVITERSPLGPFDKKFVHYSAHDMNLIVLLGIFDNIENYPYRPDYASNIILELHQKARGWFVKFFYMPRVPMKPYELHIKKCEEGHPKHRCPLDVFISLMQEYAINGWQEWMKECENSLDLVDPYDQNL